MKIINKSITGINISNHLYFSGFPDSLVGKEFFCNAGGLGLIPGLWRFPGEGEGYPLQYSGLENSVDCIVHGAANSWTQLNNFHVHYTFLNIYLYHTKPKIVQAHYFLKEKNRSYHIWFSLDAKSYPTLLRPQGLQPARLLCPWHFLVKNTWTPLISRHPFFFLPYSDKPHVLLLQNSSHYHQQ